MSNLDADTLAQRNPSSELPGSLDNNIKTPKRASGERISKRSSWMKRVFVVAICLGTYLAWRGMENSLLRPTDTRLIIEAQISSGRAVEVFINGSTTPLSVKRASKERVAYEFVGVPTSVRELRVDLTDIANAEIALFGIRFERDGSVVASYSGPTLRQRLSYSGLTLHPLPDTGIFMRSVNDDPITSFAPNIFLGRSSDIPRTLEYVEKHLTLTIMVLGLIGLIAAGGMPNVWRAVAWISALVFGWWGLTVLATLDLGPRHLPISLSVGHTSYVGYPKGTEFSLYWSCVALVLCLAATGALMRSLYHSVITRRISEPSSSERPPQAGESDWISRSASRTKWWCTVAIDVAFLAALTLFHFFAMFPHLTGKEASLREAADPGDYDGVNFFTWSAFRVFGLLPHRDYWFPYAGFYNSLYDTPYDLWTRHILSTVVWGALTLGIFLLTNRSKWSTLLITVILNLLVANKLLVGQQRYLMGLGLVLLASAALTRKFTAVILLPLGAYVGYVAGKEPNQIIYASAALGMIVALTYNLWKDHPLRMVVCTGVGVTIGSVSWVKELVQGQELELFVAFYARMSSMVTSVAIPSGLTEWILQPSGIDALVFLCGLALLFAGAFLALSDRHDRVRSPLYNAAFGAGLLFVLTFSKQLTRPHMATQLTGIVCLGILLLFAAWGTFWSTKQRIWFALWLAIFAAHLDSRWSGPYKLLTNVKRIMTLEPDLAMALSPEISSREQQHLYDRARFIPRFPFVGTLADILDQDTKATKRQPMVYVLGDESYLYPIFRQIPPRYISFYNMSDIREQREVVAWLGTHEPKYVLWRPSFKVFDGVPNVVRVPELFTYVVGHYQFHRTFDGFDLLIRKADRTDLPLGPEERNYWTTSLGQELNLRALPAISSIRDNARCEPGTVVFCEPVIRVLLNHDPDSAIPKNIDMEIDGATYRVAFTTMAKQREYFIKFSSLWFVAKTPVSQWRVTCPTGSSDCEAVGIEFRHFPNPKLY